MTDSFVAGSEDCSPRVDQRLSLWSKAFVCGVDRGFKSGPCRMSGKSSCARRTSQDLIARAKNIYLCGDQT